MTKAQTLVIRFMSFGSPMHNKYTAMSNKQWWSLWVCLLDDILKPHKNLLKDLKKPHEGFYYCWNSQELLDKLNLLISEPLWSNIWLCLQYFEEITVSWNIRSNQPKAIQTYFHGHFFNISLNIVSSVVLDFQILQKSKIYIKSDNDPTEKTESLFELRVTWWKVL